MCQGCTVVMKPHQNWQTPYTAVHLSGNGIYSLEWEHANINWKLVPTQKEAQLSIPLVAVWVLVFVNRTSAAAIHIMSRPLRAAQFGFHFKNNCSGLSVLSNVLLLVLQRRLL